MDNANRRLDTRMLSFLRVLFTILVIATIVFIFSSSVESSGISENKSSSVTDILNRVMENMEIRYSFSEHQVRKLAHFSEYMSLGFWLMLTLRVYTRRILSFISWPLFLGLLTAVTDEFFQLFVPGRSGEVKDITIDFGGILAGVMVGLFTILLLSAIWDAFHRKR